MKKKQKPSRVETIVEFLVERFKIPTRTEFENLIRKTEESLQRLKLPTMTEFNQLVKRVEELEKVAKVRKDLSQNNFRYDHSTLAHSGSAQRILFTKDKAQWQTNFRVK